ncbi:oxidoreductase [Aeromicrobium yanjiei]|uniref:SDR family oxidoreductase n=1 Tax=Aeromicrobium yanjiei TaxID=2662028 RepID=A0A5Q2MFY4_9ACTN|nr:oxidoreductase [Aeromicrobium yanjiei]QGG39966.1 SDR family oxidoreductase [Aeromicrobium yanjiei]
MDLGLTGKTAIVTGASKGIGLAVTRTLLDEGASVVAGARDAGDLPQLVADGRPVHPVEVDLSTPEGAVRVVEEAVTTYGGVDILINNVGAVRPRPDGFAAIPDEEWAWSVRMNLMAAVRTTRAALPHLLDRRGCIVSTCSVNAVLPDPLVMDYSAAKAALASFSKSLSKEVGPRGVRVNTVSPGPVATDLWLGDHGVANVVAAAGGGDAHSVAAEAAAQAATGRFTTPEEVAAMIVVLASSRAGNITGADLVMDGGLVQTL